MAKLGRTINQSITVKIVGLGGQGVVTAAAILARAAFYQGWWSQSMPFFGVERTGTPVEAYVRLANQAIRNHQAVDRPDILLVNDQRLYQSDKPGCQLTVISQPATISYQEKAKVIVYDSRQLSIAIFEQDLAIGLLGGLAAAWPMIAEENWLKALREHFANQTMVQKNQQAFLANYDLVTKIIHPHD